VHKLAATPNSHTSLTTPIIDHCNAHVNAGALNDCATLASAYVPSLYTARIYHKNVPHIQRQTFTKSTTHFRMYLSILMAQQFKRGDGTDYKMVFPFLEKEEDREEDRDEGQEVMFEWFELKYKYADIDWYTHNLHTICSLHMK
jgi:hypothetical protein